MSIYIHYGSAKTGKTTSVINDIRDKLSSGERSMVYIVPEQLSYYAEKTISEKIGFTSSNTIEVLSFERLAYSIQKELISPVKFALTPSSKVMLLHKILSENKNNLLIFGTLVDKPGFIATISDMMGEFVRYNVAEVDLKRIGENGDLKPAEIFQRKIHDLQLIYNAYILQSQLFKDSSASITELSANIISSHCMNGKTVYIDEFSDFLPNHYLAIDAMMEKCKDIHFVFCYEKDDEKSDKFALAMATIDRIKSIALLKCLKVFEIEYSNTVGYKNEQLIFLEKHYNTFSKDVFTQTSNAISITAFLGIFEEIEFTARKIVELCRDEHYKFSDIAICCGDLGSYVDFIEVIFKQYNINFFADKKIILSEHPICQAISSLFSIVSQNWDTEKILAYLKSGFSNISKHEVDCLENFVLENGINYNKWINNVWWQNKHEYYIKNDMFLEADFTQRMDSLRRRAIAPFLQFKDSINSKSTVKDYMSNTYDFLKNTGIYTILTEKVDRFTNEGDLPMAELYSRVWNILMTVLDNCVNLMGDEVLPCKQVGRMLDAGFSKEEIFLIPQSVDSVEIADGVRSRIKDKKAVFILGANSGTFPSPITGQGILLDKERKLLQNTYNIVLAKDTTSQTNDNEFLTYRILSSPSHKLFISYSLSANGGKSQRPSICINNIKSLFPTVTTNYFDMDFTQANESLLSMEKPSFNYAMQAMKMIYDGIKVHQMYHQLWQYYENSSLWVENIKAFKEATCFSNLSDDVEMAKLKLLFNETVTMSISSITKYINCPFSYFTQYLLRAKERGKLMLKNNQMGNVIHKVLEKFCNMLKDFPEGVNYEKAVEMVDKIFQSEIEININADILEKNRVRFLMNNYKRLFYKVAYTIAYQMANSRFIISGQEVPFGYENSGSINGIKLPLRDDKILKIRGFIDRIDTFTDGDNNYFRIIDYKTYDKSFQLEKIYQGLEPQLILYASAAMGQDMGNKNAGMFYFDIQNTIFQSTQPVYDYTNIEDEMINSFKLRGFALDNTDVLTAMDAKLETTSKSDIIPVSFTKNGELSKNSYTLSEKQIGFLTEHVNHVIVENINKMIDGAFPVTPVKFKAATACDYCEFSSICGFEANNGANRYRYCKSMKKEEIFQKLSNDFDNNENNIK